MRIAITGASGNLGTALLLRLGGGEGHELVGISRRPPPNAPPYSWARWHCIDISAAHALEEMTCAFAGVDAVVHLAWAIQPSHDREYMRRVNQDGTREAVRAARAAGVRQFVHVSSVGAYSPAPGTTVDESWPVGGVPSSPYSVDKAACERIVAEHRDDLVLTVVRPALVLQAAAASEISRYFLGPFGPLTAMRRGLMRLAPVPRELAVQVVHANDVAAALTTVVEQRRAGAFNVASNPPLDGAVFARVFGGVGPAAAPRVLRALAGVTWRARLQPTDPGWIDLALNAPVLDTGALQQLGWRAEHPSTDVLAEFVDALRRGAGRPGPLLRRRRRRHARPGPAGTTDT